MVRGVQGMTSGSGGEGGECGARSFMDKLYKNIFINYNT